MIRSIYLFLTTGVIKLHLASIIACISSTGCNPHDEDSKNLGYMEPIVSKTKKKTNDPRFTPSIFQQDINKSYSSINRPWVLAKPLNIDIELNASELFDE